MGIRLPGTLKNPRVDDDPHKTVPRFPYLADAQYRFCGNSDFPDGQPGKERR
jgi:hypothetical protein